MTISTTSAMFTAINNMNLANINMNLAIASKKKPQPKRMCENCKKEDETVRYVGDNNKRYNFLCRDCIMRIL